MKKLLAALVALFSFAVCAPTINGIILEKETRAPVIGANIIVRETKKGTASNEFGAFTLIGLKPGSYTLIISSIGFKEVNIPVEIKETDEPITVTVHLEQGLIKFDPVNVIMDRASMVGLSQNFLRFPGSASVVNALDLEKFDDADINRIIARIPGVYVQEEDGFGLRPNIGMRGTGVERSSKINMMEDGIPIAPAPYSSPAAYYSPTAGRMEAVEVRKGSSQIKYGPNTTGGAINYVSTSIPQDFNIKADLEAGERGSSRVHVNIGTAGSFYGILLESFSDKTRGFKHFTNPDLPTGYDKQDYLVKMRLNTPSDFGLPAALELKVSTTDETSHETYLGLTRSDFLSDPLRRYDASAIDEMIANHKQTVVTGVISPLKNFDLMFAVYKNEFDRNWYKLDKVGGTKIASLLSEGNSHNNYYLLDASNTSNDEFQIKANNRMYTSNGVQLIGTSRFNFRGSPHSLMLGVRKHTDKMDRFQKVDKYGMQDGSLVMTTTGVWGTGSKNNRLYKAEATSYFLEDEMNFGRINLTVGFRTEEFLVERSDWSGDADGGDELWNDPNRELIPTVKNKKMQVFVPGLGIVYQVRPSLQFLAGIHKGYSPPGPGVDEDDEIHPEESINIEWGGRLKSGFTQVHAIAFHNRFKNLLGDDTQFAGEGTYDQFNAGKVNVDGLEFSMTHKMKMGTMWVPLTFNYTYTKTEFRTRFESDYSPWGSVEAGEELPYIPAHQTYTEAGIVNLKWNIYLRFRSVSSMRTVAGKGELLDSEKTDALSVVDLAGEFQLAKNIEVYIKIINSLDHQGIVAARPAGVRPTMPRTFLGGIRFRY